MDKEEALRRLFGHQAFRDGQEELIDSILSGRDVLGIMPTGGGKSVCYQIPAVLLPGITIVVSPLISLMADQVAALKDTGVRAAYINSTLTMPQLRTVYSRMEAGAYQIVYVAPERLTAEGFLSVARRLNISLVAVDEAHCVSQWGQDFRPSYLHIADFLEQLPCRPVVAAFTATATDEVRQDIIRLLDLQDPCCVVTGFDRPNLFFKVLRPKNKPDALQALLLERKGKCGIVYCATRAAVDQLWEAVNRWGIPAARYHAGMSDEDRRENQDEFQYDRKPVMIATNAFGMGIDKSNVSFVIHYHMPKSPEAYYQEAGRAGRDGAPAECILLFSGGDVRTARFLIENGNENGDLTPEERSRILERDYERLERMVGYCKTTECLRGYLLDYFGETHPEHCGNCSNCRASFVSEDITRQAQMILSCVKRIQDRLGYSVGGTLVVQVLRGSQDKRVLELGLDQLSTYGLLRQSSKAAVNDWVDCLESQGYLRTNPSHSTLELTDRAGEVLFSGKRVEMPVRKAKEATAPAAKTVPAPAEADEGLADYLKSVRMDIAREERVPAYIVFSNATLMDMARKRPHTQAEFLEVSGVGAMKAERYGGRFLEAIRTYEEKVT